MVNPERIAKGLYWDRAWSLVAGCSPVSPGCDNCWAAREAHMRASQQNEKIRACYEGLTTEEGRWNGQVRMLDKNLDLPLRVKKPTVWAVWNDLFHDKVPLGFIAEAFSVMRKARYHLFLLLTKRPLNLKLACDGVWPKDCNHIWVGTTCENQEQAEARIPVLLQIPVAVRFVSVEPMLGPVNLNPWIQHPRLNAEGTGWASFDEEPGIHWVICGGESGPDARPMHPDWVRSLRDQCVAAGVPFFFKQWGEWLPAGQEQMVTICCNDDRVIHADADDVFRVGKKKAGRLLDGREWDQMPGVDKHAG